MRYVLGVDGGNTKTDYMLFDENGGLVRNIRRGTISHEGVAGGFPESGRLLREHMLSLLDGLQISVADIAASAMGLAGLDMPSQHENMRAVLDDTGFQNYVAVNDGFLGLKAAGTLGFGVCSINGTGTVAVGIDPQGERLQVGGVGLSYGDEGGAWHLARAVVRRVYDHLYRCGPYTALVGPICELFEVSDKSRYVDRVIPRFNKKDITDQPVNDILFDVAETGDEVAIAILEHAGTEMARSAAGCAVHLGFGGEIEVVMAGSMWIKPHTMIMVNAFEREFSRLTEKSARFIRLELPPVCGAVLWALELLRGTFPDAELKAKVLSQIQSLKL